METHATTRSREQQAIRVKTRAAKRSRAVPGEGALAAGTSVPPPGELRGNIVRLLHDHPEIDAARLGPSWGLDEVVQISLEKRLPFWRRTLAPPLLS